jgi:putative membrane protein
MIDKEITGGPVKLLGIVIITLIALVVAVFTVLNAEPVELNFYYAKTAYPLSVVIVVVLIVGAVLGVMACLRVIVRLKRENARIKKQIELTEQEVANLRRLPLRDID